jgi:scyllo-inositol 2-dehydrogenase (NADP+)
MSEIGVGIIGYGLAGRVFHGPFISAVPGLALKAIVQRTGEEAANAYPQADILRSVPELLVRKDISLVVVATPNETHFRLAKQALEAGKHVVIDKPFAATSGEARSLIELAQEMGLVLAPFHNRRWDGDFLTVKKVLSSGKLGRLVSFESHFDRFRPVLREGTWKESQDPANGLLFDLAPHLVDQCLDLFGSPETVTASVRLDRDGSQIEDAFDIALKYQGLIAWCRSSMLACDASPRFLLHGTAGSFKKYGLDPQEPALVAGAKVPPMGSHTVWLEEEKAHWGTLTVAPVPADPARLDRTVVMTEPGDYRNFYANVRDAVSGAAKLVVSAEAGLDAIRVLELARASSAEGRAVKF